MTAGQAFHDAFRQDVELAGPEQEALLEQACAMLDEIESMTARIEANGEMLDGSRGQKVAHPLITEVRRHRAAFAALVKQLCPEEAPRAGQGTRAGRDLAQARWRRT
jgi:hypothetical protein